MQKYINNCQFPSWSWHKALSFHPRLALPDPYPRIATRRGQWTSCVFQSTMGTWHHTKADPPNWHNHCTTSKADNCQHFNTSHDWHNWHTWSKPANVIQQTSLISQETVVWSFFLAHPTLSYLMPLLLWYLGNEPAESHHWQQSKQNILHCR